MAIRRNDSTAIPLRAIRRNDDPPTHDPTKALRKINLAGKYLTRREENEIRRRAQKEIAAYEANQYYKEKWNNSPADE